MITLYEKRQHNLGLPISYLPNEILSKIFFNVRNASTEISARTDWEHVRHKPIKLAGWISLTHVCRAWREIALNTALLWSYINILPSDALWIPELLRRSKHSPLTLLVSTHRNVPLDEVEKHFGRVCELVLFFSEEDTLHTIFSSLPNFRNLETLDISQSGWGLPQRRFVLADTHLGTQRLKTLNLNYCAIDFNSKFLQGLTHLRLESLPIDYALATSDFALVLSRISRLETLYLFNSLHDKKGVENAANVQLQYLRELFVHSQIPFLAQFLSCLIIPRSCKIGISIWNHKSDKICDEFRVILSWVSNHLSVPTTTSSDATDHEPYIRTLHFVHERSMLNFKVEGFCNILSHEQVAVADPILKFTVLWMYDDDFSSSLQTFFSLLPLEGVVFIDMYSNFSVRLSVLAPEFWTVAFGSIETLKAVYLDTSSSNFWEAIAPPDSDNRAKSLPFSALSSVTVKDHILDFQLVVNKLRLRSQLGGTQLQDLHIISVGKKSPASIITQLGDLVSRTQIVDCDAHGRSDEGDDVIVS